MIAVTILRNRGKRLGWNAIYSRLDHRILYLLITLRRFEMKYAAYPNTKYEYKTIVAKHKMFDKTKYQLYEVFPNYNGFEGHKTAQNFAEDLRAMNQYARVVAHSGFTAVYIASFKSR
jgi:type I restriction-modification system DNA methylase subunit